MKVLEFLPNKRSLAFSIFILLLFGIFFGGYFYYYIPANKANLHHNAFLILENIKTNIQGRNLDLQRLYNTFYNEKNKSGRGGQPGSLIQRLLDSNRVAGKAIADAALFRSPARRDSSTHEGADGFDHEVRLDSISRSNLIYLPYKSNASEKVAIVLPVENILKPILQAQRSEVIKSYVLMSVHNNVGTLVYKDPELGIRSDIPLDSLLPGKKNAFFAGIRDLKMEEEDYKVFYYPFNLENQQLLLCGFINTKDYSTQLNEIPVSFIYPLVILFLSLLIALPVIKLYIMGSEEQVRLSDLFSLGMSFFVGATMITFIVIQILLLLGANERAKDDLNTLAEKIQVSFDRELSKTIKQIDSLDAFMNRSIESGSTGNDSRLVNVNASGAVKRFLAEHPNDTVINNPFDRVVWIDSSGRQRIKAQIEPSKPLFTDVSRRKYYQLFKTNEPYVLAGDGRFALEPVYSWTNGEFRVITSKETTVKSLYVISLSTQMYALTQALLPAGYGFCIIDQEGNVQIHADASRNLQENFFKKLESPRRVQEAVTSRQQNFFPDLRFYGKRNALHIRPLSKVPLFLITYYDTGLVFPVNMRILSFALLFCFVFYLVCVSIWLVALRKRSSAYPMVFSPMVYFKWIVPKQKATGFYFYFSVLLLLYIAVVFLSIFVTNRFHINHYVILMIVLITPVNIVSALFVVSYATNNVMVDMEEVNARARSRKFAWQAMIYQAVISVVVYGYAYYFGYPIEPHFFLFQGAFNGLLWICFLNESRLANSMKHTRVSYLTLFTGLIMLLIICLAILPAALNTWYAHNQEITQSVKKQQLFLARAIEKRKTVLNGTLAGDTAFYLPPDYFNRLTYQAGIYHPYRNDVSWITGPGARKKRIKSFEEFYFRIADYISYSYNDPQLYPALKDSASDNAWSWSNQDSTLSFLYEINRAALPGNSFGAVTTNSFEIATEVPPRYIFLKLDIRGFWLTMIVLGLLTGMFLLLRSLLEKLFLKKFIVTADPREQSANQQKLFAEFAAFKGSVGVPGADVPDIEHEYLVYRSGGSKELVFTQEKAILEALVRYDKFYSIIWEKCTDKEKYLLFDFAGDGFVNYKNVSDLYHLMVLGIITINQEEMKLFAPSFRAFVLCKKNSPGMFALQKKYRENSTWQGFRIPLLILFLGTAGFIFITQEESFQKFMGLVAGASTLLSLLLKYFADGGRTAIPKNEPKV